MLSRSERLKRKRARRKQLLRKTVARIALGALVACAAAAVWWGFGGGELPEPPWGGRGHEASPAGPPAGPADSASGPPQSAAGKEAPEAAGGPSDRQTDKADRPSDNGSAGQSPSGSGAQGGSRPPSTVTISFVGDVMMAGNVERLVAQHGYDYPFRHVRELLLKSDLSVANLETSVTEGGEPQDKQYVYRTKPKALESMRDHGIRLVTLANNHSMDYGVEGFLDTLDHLKQTGILYVGGGRNEAEAYRPAVVELNGVRTAFLGFSMVVPHASWKAEGDRSGVAQTYDYRQPTEAIRKARQEADLVVVLVHWGEERKEEPNARQKEMARRYIDAGADLVVGSHPHVLQGAENYKGKWIFYSLGNFIFTTNDNPLTWDSVILNASCTKEGACDLSVVPVRNAWALPTPLEGEEAARVLGRLSDLSINAKVNGDGNIEAVPDSGENG
jgi:poly-gamma-glutamate synthesis protein (capsule biosynthesis protein)